jgi:hypothetical protein
MPAGQDSASFERIGIERVDSKRSLWDSEYFNVFQMERWFI